MRSAALLWFVASSLAMADEGVTEAKPRPFAPPGYVRALLGLGLAPLIPGEHMPLTIDIGAHTFGDAFSTGFSTSLAADVRGHWFIVTPGLFIQLDVSYLFWTRMWSVEPPSDPPLRIHVGTRIGLDVSQSFPQRDEQPFASLYTLVRPSLHTFIDLEIPFGPKHLFAFVFRAAVDSPVGSFALFRQSLSVGISRGWDE